MVFFGLRILLTRCKVVRTAASGPGDFVNALYLHFFRTGDFQSLELAEETLGPIADAGLIAEEPLQVGLRAVAPVELSTQSR